MELKDIIYSDTILLDSHFKTRSEVFSYFASVLFESQLISNQQDFINGLNNKEKEISTAIGYEMAIPHIQSSSVHYPIVSFMRSQQGVFWEDKENSKVKLIFLIAVPKKLINEHINILATISRKLMNEEIRARLLKMDHKDDIFQILV